MSTSNHRVARLPGTEYRRLGFFYAAYFASLGCLMPYWGLYLHDLGLNENQIGLLFAVLLGTKLIGPNLLGWLADHTGQGLGVIRAASLLAVLLSLPLLQLHGYTALLVLMALFGFFWNAALPLYEALTLHRTEGDGAEYSRIRVWGSVGFIVAVLLVGAWLEHAGTGALPGILSATLAAIALSSWLTRPSNDDSPHLSDGNDDMPFHQQIRRFSVLGLLLMAALMQCSHGPYYTFYSLYLQDAAYSKTQIAGLWTLGVVAEMLVFMAMRPLLNRINTGPLLQACFALAALRWLLIASASDMLITLALAQLLHAASFAVFHAVLVARMHQLFPKAQQSRAQGLYSSFSFGAGGALGSAWAGMLWLPLGGEQVFLLAALLSLLGWGFAYGYSRAMHSN